MIHVSEEFVLNKYKELAKHEGEDLCHKRRVDAALILDNGAIYYGTNGCTYDPCTKKGPDSCIREEGVLEYVTCPSFCAEGNAMIGALGLNYDLINSLNELGLNYDLVNVMVAALFDEKVLEGSTLITTGSPCPRCSAIATDAGIKRVYFANYKEKKARLKDALHATEMTSSGVEVYRILQVVDEHGIIEPIIKKIDHGPDLRLFTVGKSRTSGEAYVRMFFDEAYRKGIMDMAKFYKEYVDPFLKIDNDCLIFQPHHF